MSTLLTMFEFAYGKEVNYGNEIPIPVLSLKKLDFTKDVVGYGFAIRHGKDLDLSEAKNIIIDCYSIQKLNGIIELKTENSNGSAEHTIPLNFEKRGLVYAIPPLSSPLKEVVLWFPKQLNTHTDRVDMKFRFITFF